MTGLRVWKTEKTETGVLYVNMGYTECSEISNADEAEEYVPVNCYDTQAEFPK